MNNNYTVFDKIDVKKFCFKNREAFWQWVRSKYTVDEIIKGGYDLALKNQIDYYNTIHHNS